MMMIMMSDDDNNDDDNDDNDDDKHVNITVSRTPNETKVQHNARTACQFTYFAP